LEFGVQSPQTSVGPIALAATIFRSRKSEGEEAAAGGDSASLCTFKNNCGTQLTGLWDRELVSRECSSHLLAVFQACSNKYAQVRSLPSYYRGHDASEFRFDGINIGGYGTHNGNGS
jgi:hypothetical protein